MEEDNNGTVSLPVRGLNSWEQLTNAIAKQTSMKKCGVSPDSFVVILEPEAKYDVMVSSGHPVKIMLKHPPLTEHFEMYLYAGISQVPRVRRGVAVATVDNIKKFEEWYAQCFTLPVRATKEAISKRTHHKTRFKITTITRVEVKDLVTGMIEAEESNYSNAFDMAARIEERMITKLNRLRESR